LEINAESTDGAGYDERIRRTVGENATQLGAEAAEFE
jgi:hypothetical protein